MVFHTLYEPVAGIYQVQVGYRIEGPLDEELFERSWNRVLVRHPILRTSFVQDGLEEPLQAVWGAVTIRIDRHDLTGLSPGERRRHLEAAVSSGRRPFALDEPPLMRLALFRESENSRVLLWGMHHALLDGWSKSVVLADVFAEYEAALRGEVRGERAPRVFRDYIVWLEARKHGLGESEAFWRNLLKGFSAGTRLLADAVPAVPPNGGESELPEIARRHLRLTKELTERIRSFARRERTTLNLVLQAAWAALLSRYSGETDLVFGATVSTRPPSLPDSASIVGLLINTVPVRVRIGVLDSFRGLIDVLRRQQADRSPHEDAPLMSIQAWSEIPRGTQLFESVFVFENFPEESLRVRDGDLSIRREFCVQRSHYAIELGVIPGEELALELGFDARRFACPMMERFLKHLEQLVQGMLADPDMPIAGQRMLTEAEEHRVLFEFNDTDSPRSDPVSLTRLFEARVESDPDAIAIVDGSARMTYVQVDHSANRLAKYLTASGVGPETLVGLQAGRGAPMIVAVLGILKAGGAYLPIDPSYPANRRRFMIEDSGVRLILTDRIEGEGEGEGEGESEPTSPALVRTISLDDIAGLVAQQSPATLDIPGPTPRSLAYVLYTSGSSGHPKGVEIEHASAANHVRRAAESFELRKGDRLLQFASLSFDTSVQEIFGALTAGATLFLRPANIIDSVAGFLAACSEWNLTVLDLPTAYWHEVVASASAEELSLPACAASRGHRRRGRAARNVRPVARDGGGPCAPGERLRPHRGIRGGRILELGRRELDGGLRHGADRSADIQRPDLHSRPRSPAAARGRSRGRSLHRRRRRSAGISKSTEGNIGQLHSGPFS